MPILSMVFSALSGPILDKLIAPLTHIFDQFINKQITEAQLREQMTVVLAGAFKEIEVAHAEMLTAMYQSFMGAVVQSKIMQRTWAFVTISQGIMLLWFQFGIPLIVALGLVKSWPSAGTTADWAYLLVGGLCGLGLATKGSGVAGALKSLVVGK